MPVRRSRVLSKLARAWHNRRGNCSQDAVILTGTDADALVGEESGLLEGQRRSFAPLRMTEETNYVLEP
jgi:hypothetical protein